MKSFFIRHLGFLAALFVLTNAAASDRAALAAEIAFETDRSLPLVYFNVALKAGAVADPAGASGLTNFMGEMLLRGTRSRTKEQIDLAVDQMGARLAIETRAEALILRGAVLASQLQPFLDLVLEILTQPAFAEVELRKLKGEIVSGILQGLASDASLGSLRFTRFLFRDHPYGNPILGRTKDVEAFTRDKVVRHYETLFQDPLLLVVGSGDAPEATIRDWAAKLAQARPANPQAPAEALIRTKPPEDAPARRLLLIDKPERTQTQIYIGQIGVRLTDPDFFALHVGNYAFGGPTFSSRLMTEIRVKRGWSYGASSGFRAGIQPRSWITHFFPAAKDAPEAVALALQLINSLEEKGLEQTEFDFTRQSIINGAGFMYDTPVKRVENRLLERTLELPDGFMSSYGSRVALITLPEVNAALKRFLKPERLAIGVLGTAQDLKAPLSQAAGVPEQQIEVRSYTQE